MLAKAHIWGSIIWPAFLGACALELVVFAAFDPHDCHWYHRLSGGHEPAGMHAGVLTIYSIGFVIFWLVGIGAGSLSYALRTRPESRGSS